MKYIDMQLCRIQASSYMCVIVTQGCTADDSEMVN